jgi:hypothetical protein
MSYQDIVQQLERQGYQVSGEVRADESILITLIQGGAEVGYITFMISEQSTGEKRATKYRIGDEETEVCSINFISVNSEFQGRGLGYYLMLLAALYTKEHFPTVTHAKLDDCSDKSGDVVGNLYFKTKLTSIEPQKLLLPGEVPGSMPLTNKRGSLHIPQCGPERAGRLDDIISSSLLKIKRGGKSRKHMKNRKSRKAKRTKRNKKSRKNNKSIRYKK